MHTCISFNTISIMLSLILSWWLFQYHYIISHNFFFIFYPGLMLTRKNLNKIKGQFSSLLVKVQSALKSQQVSVDEIRSFLVHSGHTGYFVDVW